MRSKHGSIPRITEGPRHAVSEMERDSSSPALCAQAARSSVAQPVCLELVGRRIRQLRREHKWTQEELAHRLRLHPQDLARMERGERRVSLDTLRDLMTVFEVGLHELLEGSAAS
jgi:ribosome-binding protein aMBF1 (putative translation factor)